ncbi:MAG: sensor histidine kinase [Acidithiobacillales bacterium]
MTSGWIDATMPKRGLLSHRALRGSARELPRVTFPEPSPRPEATGEGAEVEAQRALFQRPRFSVVARIAAAFGALFVLLAGITVLAVVLISNLKVKQGSLERASAYEFEIQQARRYEKNFFLYGTNLDDALSSVHMAETYLERNREELESVLGARKLAGLRESLGAYRTGLERLLHLSQSPSAAPAEERLSLQTLLRRHGAQIVVDAEENLDRERLAVHAALNTALVSAVGFLVFMVVTMVLVAAFLARTVLQPVARFTRYMERIGAGDYSPITPVRKYRDEFSNLAMVMNRTLHELKAHQERLVHSERMAAVGSLTSGIAHELNNPLNNISLTTETLISDFASFPDEEKLRMLDQIFTQVERASATVRQLLDFTRKDQPAFTHVAVAGILESTLKLIGNELSLAKVEARLEADGNLPEVLGNPRNLQQVFLNLCLNGVQAMQKGGILAIRARRDGDALVRIDVGDSGVGIAPENLGKIFEPFFTTKEAGKGTGLGLTVVKSIVEKHGGRITVESGLGKGSTFTVFLPVAPPKTREG